MEPCTGEPDWICLREVALRAQVFFPDDANALAWLIARFCVRHPEAVIGDLPDRALFNRAMWLDWVRVAHLRENHSRH